MSKRIRLLSLLMRSGEFERSSAAEKLITEGRVSADGKTITDPKHSVRLKSEIRLNGSVLKKKPLTYLILDKPSGLICQKSAKERTVYDLIASIEDIDPKARKTLFSVGRLDRDTEGLLIVTNDGQLEKLLTRKENRIVKTYVAETKKPVSEKDVLTLKEGVEIRDDDTGKAFFVKALHMKKLGEKRIELGIGEGRKRQVKKMLRAVGNEVTNLKRTGIGKLHIQDLDFKGKRYIVVNRGDLEF